MAAKRIKLYIANVDFEMSGGHMLRRKISERGLNQTSVRNKLKKRYANKKKYGKMHISSIVSYD
jgi:hypothetical protein